jgi:hypothetical protein
VKAEALEIIERNIADFGHHIYLVTGEASPRFAYTIGLSSTVGSELLLAGASFYSADQVRQIINRIGDVLKQSGDVSKVDLDELGTFTLKKASPEWIESLMLGAVQYYSGKSVSAWQVLPDEDHWTVDVPKLHESPTAAANRPWTWFFEKWPYRVPRHSIAMTNLAALKGATITEAARWEETEWELFAGPGPDVKREDARVVPLGVLLGADATLRAVVDLEVGGALWRDDEGGDWNVWERAGEG